jgi:hypothetical protein
MNEKEDRRIVAQIMRDMAEANKDKENYVTGIMPKHMLDPVLSFLALLEEHQITNNEPMKAAISFYVSDEPTLNRRQKRQVKEVIKQHVGLAEGIDKLMRDFNVTAGDEFSKILANYIRMRNVSLVVAFDESRSGSGAEKAPVPGYLPTSEPPSEEAQVGNNRPQIIENILFIQKQKPMRRGGRPPRRGGKKSKGPKLRMFGIKLTPEEFALIEDLRTRTGVFSAADTIRGALRTYDVITAAIDAGEDVILEDPKNKASRKYLKLG